MNKKWEIYQTNEEKVEKLQEKYKLNRLLSTLLTNRGITEEAEITKFLNPKRSDFMIHLECLIWKKLLKEY